MKEFIHLFTPVTEGLPFAYIRGGWDGLKSDPLFVLDKNGYPHSAVMYEGVLDGNRFKDFYDRNDMPIDNVTHFLDLSKLTTKERAEKLASKAFSEGVFTGSQYQGGHYNNYDDFINENKHIL